MVLCIPYCMAQYRVSHSVYQSVVSEVRGGVQPPNVPVVREVRNTDAASESGAGDWSCSVVRHE